MRNIAKVTAAVHGAISPAVFIPTAEHWNDRQDDGTGGIGTEVGGRAIRRADEVEGPMTARASFSHGHGRRWSVWEARNGAARWESRWRICLTSELSADERRRSPQGARQHS